jgi:hypothetical protein
MMDPMHDADDLTIECATCPATGTTACGDCIVTHLLANDDGPIEYTPATHRGQGSVDDVDIDDLDIDDLDIDDLDIDPGADEWSVDGRSLADRALSLFAAAGLIDDPPQFASPSEFGDVSPAGTGSPSPGRGVAR